MVDSVPERLAKVKEMGAIPSDFTKGDPVEGRLLGEAS